MDLSERLRTHTGLTPTDKYLRDYFLRCPEKAARMNTRQLADATFTSPSAVVRFCRKFGYQGLNDFKAAYFSSMPDTPVFDLPDGNFPFHAETDAASLAQNIIKLEAGTLNRLASAINTSRLEKAADMLCSSQAINLCAVGTGYYLISEFGFRLMKLGFHVNDVSSGVNLSYIANQMNEDHCLFIISYSGANEPIGNAIYQARRHNTPVLLVTSQPKSPAAKLSDLVLSVPPIEATDEKISTFSSSAAEKAILDILFALLFQKNYAANCDFVHEDAARLTAQRSTTFYNAMNFLNKDKNGK